MQNISKRKQTNPRFPFTCDEDLKLKKIIKNQLKTEFNSITTELEESINWIKVSKMMGNRTSRQCKERYMHYLSPRINKNEWTSDEELKLIEEVSRLGKRWKLLEKVFKDRTEIDIRNRFYVLQRRISKAKRSKFSINNIKFERLKVDFNCANYNKKEKKKKNEELKIDKSLDTSKDNCNQNSNPFDYLNDLFKEFPDISFDDDDQKYIDNSNKLELFNGCMYDTIFLNGF